MIPSVWRIFLRCHPFGEFRKIIFDRCTRRRFLWENREAETSEQRAVSCTGVLSALCLIRRTEKTADTTDPFGGCGGCDRPSRAERKNRDREGEIT